MNRDAMARWSKPNTILVATNLLEGHQLTLHAIYQARLSHARVLLVHVVPPSHLPTMTCRETPTIFESPLARNVRAKLDRTVREFEREGIACEPVVLEGLPGEQIPRLAKARSVDRVLITTRNTDGIARLVEESVAEVLIASLPMPVCVIGRRTHPGAALGTPPGRVLVAASLHEGSTALVRFGSVLAEAHRSPLTLLHVVDTASFSSQQRELARFAARKKLADLIPVEARHREAPRLLVREGDVASAILAEAGPLSEDLILLGSSYPSVISWILGTSVVRRVVIESECPVITLKTRDTEESVGDGAEAEAMLAEAEALAGSTNKQGEGAPA